jgi:two-component system LytT family sensor kinase
MKYPDFRYLFPVILFASAMLVIGLYVLARFNSLFSQFVKIEWLRKNIVVWLAAMSFGLAISPTNRELYDALNKGLWARFVLIEVVGISIMAFFVFNIAYLVSRLRPVQKMSFKKQMGITLTLIIVCTMITGLPTNYLGNGGNFKNVELTLLFNFYTGSMCGLVYVTMSYVNLERQRKLGEKELELSRMGELKTKAELDALHSKVNPHFLYNALNSIADLSITDGKKARQMTIALADLFRYSINYSHNNFSMVKDEIMMTEVYLQIEKVRFEDQLTYSVKSDEEAAHYLLPRFLLQPLAENAVKHGLKATGKLTEIQLEVKKNDKGLEICVADNGPSFPGELIPGYGVKSVFDKLDLLFPDQYEIFFRNQPRKEVSICIYKLMKNEPAV